MRRLLFASAALFGLSPIAAFAQGTPIVDASHIGQIVEVVRNGQQQLGQLQQMYSMAQQTRSLIGSAGGLAQPFSISGPWQNLFSGGGLSLRSLAGFAPNMSSICGGANINVQYVGNFNPCQMAGGSANFSSFTDTRSWINKAMYLAQPADSNTYENLRRARSNLATSSAEDGLANAIVARQSISRSLERATALEGIVGQATDLRSDIQANSAIASAIYQQDRQRTSILSSLVQLQASQRIAADPNLLRTSTAP